MKFLYSPLEILGRWTKRTGIALAALVIAAPVAAQVPKAELRNFLFGDCDGGTCAENITGCPGQISVRLIPAPRIATQVRLIAVPRSGHNRLRDYGVPVYMDETDTRTIRSSETITIRANDSTYYPTREICWRNDHLDTGDSVVEVVIVGGVGYQTDPTANSVTFTITEDDDCANPGDRTVYVPVNGNMNNTCVCRTRAVAAELYPGSVKQANGQDWNHTLDDYYVTINGNRSLRSSRDSSRYCPDSPYQGPEH